MKLLTKNNEKLDIIMVNVINEKGLPDVVFPNQIQKILFENEGLKDLKDYELARFGRISVAFKTFIDREAKEDEIELSLWNKNFKSRWTIASFEKDFEDDDWMGYKLVSCGERLNNEDINYSNFGKAVKFAYEILNKYYFKHNKED